MGDQPSGCGMSYPDSVWRSWVSAGWRAMSVRANGGQAIGLLAVLGREPAREPRRTGGNAWPFPWRVSFHACPKI